MQGERFNEFKKDNFYQIQWRPRPASLLTSAEKKKVVKNLRKVTIDFELRCTKQSIASDVFSVRLPSVLSAIHPVLQFVDSLWQTPKFKVSCLCAAVAITVREAVRKG